MITNVLYHILYIIHDDNGDSDGNGNDNDDDNDDDKVGNKQSGCLLLIIMAFGLWMLVQDSDGMWWFVSMH